MALDFIVAPTTDSGGPRFPVDKIVDDNYVLSKITWGALGTATQVAAATPMPVQLRDSSGNELSSHLSTLSGAIRAEDSAHVTGAVGIMSLAVRQDTAASLAGTDADYVPLIVDSLGRLHVNIGAIAAGDNNIGNVDVLSIVPGVAATSLGKAEDAAHVTGDTGVAMLAVRRDTAASGVGADGDYATLNVDVNGRLHVVTDLTKLEDAAHTSGDPGIQLLTVRTDTAVARAGTDADYQPLITDANGRLHVAIGTSALPTGAATEATLAPMRSALDQIEDLLSTLSQINATPHDDPDADNPLKVGFRAVTSLNGLTLVAANDLTNAHADLDGAQITRLNGTLADIVSGNASNTDGSSTQVIAAAGSGIKQYLSSVILTNTSATTTYAELKSGTTVKATFIVPAGGGVVHRFDPPLPPNAANEAWNFDPGTAVTTMYCSMVAIKSKV